MLSPVSPPSDSSNLGVDLGNYDAVCYHIMVSVLKVRNLIGEEIKYLS